MISIIDNWHPNPGALVQLASRLPFSSVEQGGAKFPGIAPTDTHPWLKLSELVGEPATHGVEFFRRYDEGATQPTYIHTDEAMGKWSAILYLNKEPLGGTAFWRPLIDNADPFTQAHWHCHLKVEGVYNRLLVFPSHLWHSRWPRNSAGRLIQVFFWR